MTTECVPLHPVFDVSMCVPFSLLYTMAKVGHAFAIADLWFQLAYRSHQANMAFVLGLYTLIQKLKEVCWKYILTAA